MGEASNNLQRAQAVLEACFAQGISSFCVCAGARNAPLVELLAVADGPQIYNFFEERAAAFFALGLIQAQGRPVAVVTTSGTAVAECLPGVIEAHYQGLPLMIVSADRPSRFRGTGSPQAIEHVGIFSHYVESTWNFEENLKDGIAGWSQQRPFHINVAFEEPKRNSQTPVLRMQAETPCHSARSLDGSEKKTLENPLVIVGGLVPKERSLVLEFLRAQKVPLYVEALSGLRGELPSLLSLDGVSGETFSSVLRIGGVPTCRYWRDLEENYKDIPVLNVVAENSKWAGLARPSTTWVGFENLQNIVLKAGNQTTLLEEDQRRSERLQALLQKYPQSELALVRELSRKLAGQQIYLGNSLPIRHWDLVSASTEYKDVYANRGANGIDGQISTFLGWTAQKGPEAWAVIGDLTAMYDLAAPWVSGQLQMRKRRIVVINNFGGMIFKKLFRNEGFLNRHQFQFGDWAKQWGWDYQTWKEIPSDADRLNSSSIIIELTPDEKQSDFFQEEWSRP